MSYSTILGAIKTLLDAVTGIGNTFDYMRLETNVTSQKSRFVKSTILHSWFITRSAAECERLGNKQVKRIHQYDIWGFYAVDDDNASEKTFQALCETIQDKFDDVDNIGLVSGVLMIDASDIIAVDHVVWCNTLCHRAQIRIYAEEDKSVA